MTFLSGLFTKRQKTIVDVSLDDLMMARVKLEKEQKRVIDRIHGIEKQKQALFQQGVGESSTRMARLLAEKIRDLDMEAKNYDKNLAAFSKQLRTINGFMFLKQNRLTWENTPLGQLLGNMDLSQLENFVDQATANDMFQMDKFERLLGSLEESDSLTKQIEEDADILEIMKAFQAARESGTPDVGLEQAGRSATTEANELNRR